MDYMMKQAVPGSVLHWMDRRTAHGIGMAGRVDRLGLVLDVDAEKSQLVMAGIYKEGSGLGAQDGRVALPAEGPMVNRAPMYAACGETFRMTEAGFREKNAVVEPGGRVPDGTLVEAKAVAGLEGAGNSAAAPMSPTERMNAMLAGMDAVDQESGPVAGPELP